MFYIFLITYKGDVSLYLGGKFCFSRKNPSKEGPTIWLLRWSIGDFRKNNLQTDFEEKKFLKGNTGRKKIPFPKKWSFTAYNPEKYYYTVVCQEKNSITRG